MTKFKFIAGTAALLAVMAAVTPASAQWRGGYHRGGGYYRGGGYGIGAGLATGLIVGGALAASNRGYYGDGYYAQGPGGNEEYCMQRYRSYDPGSGTYLGFDGRRHPC